VTLGTGRPHCQTQTRTKAPGTATTGLPGSRDRASSARHPSRQPMTPCADDLGLCEAGAVQGDRPAT